MQILFFVFYKSFIYPQLYMQKHGNTRYHHGGNGVRLINNSYSGAIHDHARKSDVIISKNLMSPVAIYKQAQAGEPLYFKNSNMPPVAQLIKDRVSPRHVLEASISPKRLNKLTLTSSRSRELSPANEQLRESQMYRIANPSTVELLSPSKQKLQMKQDYLEYFDQINKAQSKYINVMKYQTPQKNIDELLKVYRDEKKDAPLVAPPGERAFNTVAPETIRVNSNLKKEEREGMKTSMTNLNSERVKELVEKNIQIKKDRIRKEMEDAGAEDDLRQSPRDRSPVHSPGHDTIQGPKFSPLSLRQKANLKKEQLQRDQMNSDLKVIIDEIKTERTSEKKKKHQKQEKNTQSGSPRLPSPAEERRRLDTNDNPPSVLQESFAMEAQQTFQEVNQLDLNQNYKFTRTNLSINSEENMLTQDELKLLPEAVNEAVTLSKGAPFASNPASVLQLDHSADEIEQAFLNYSNSNSQEKIEKYKQNIEYLKRHDTIIKDFVISKCPSILFEPHREIEIPRDNLGLTDNHYERIHNYQSKKRQKPQLHQKKFDIQLQPRHRNHVSASVNLNPKFMKDSTVQKASTIAKNSRNEKLFKSLATEDINLTVLRSVQGGITSPKAYALRETTKLPLYGLKRSPDGGSGLTIQVEGRESRNSKKFNSTGQSVFQANLANLSPRMPAEVDVKFSPAITIMSTKRVNADTGRLPHLPKHVLNPLSMSLDDQSNVLVQMRQAAKVRQINHFNAPIPKLPTIFGPAPAVNYSSKLMAASTSPNTSPREQLSKQTDLVNKFLSDLIGNNKDQGRDERDEILNGKPKKLKLFDNKRNKQIQIQSPKKMMETQISLNNSESLRQSLIQWNKNLVRQVDGTGIPISLYFKNQPNSKQGQRKMINIEQIRENSRDSEANEKLYKEAAGAGGKRRRDEKQGEAHEQDNTQTTEVNKINSRDRSDRGKDPDQPNPSKEDERPSALLDQVRRPAVRSKFSAAHSKGSSFKVSMKEPNNANLPIMKQIIKLTKDQRAQNGVIQFNRKSELGDQGKKESLTLKDDTPHSNLGIWAQRQITKTGLSSHSVTKAPRQDNVSILQMNEHHLIRKPKNDLLAQNMTPWHNDNQAIAELLADEAASPNILDSKLGNRSIVRPLSHRSSGSSVKYTDQTVTSHIDSKDRKSNINPQAAGPSRLSQFSQGPKVLVNQQDQAAMRQTKSKMRVSKKRTGSLAADQTRRKQRSPDQQNQMEQSQRSRKSGSRARSNSLTSSSRRQADEARQTVTRVPYLEASGATSSPQGVNRSRMNSTANRDKLLRQSRTDGSKGSQKVQLKQIRVQPTESRASAGSELTPTNERNPLKALGRGSISTPSQEDDAMTESRFDDELLDEVPDQIGPYEGQRPTKQQRLHPEHGEGSEPNDTPGGSPSGSDSDVEASPASGTQSVSTGGVDFRKAKLREGYRARSVVVDFPVGSDKLDGNHDAEILRARREMDARMQQLKAAHAQRAPGTRVRGDGSDIGGRSVGSESDLGQPGDSSGGDLGSLDLLEPQPEKVGRQQSYRGLAARLTKSLSVAVPGGGADDDNLGPGAADESVGGRRRTRVAPEFLVPRAKMSFADNKEEIDRFIKQLNKDVSQMPVGIQRYIASKEKEKEDTYTQVIQSQQKIHEKLVSTRAQEPGLQRRSSRKGTELNLVPQKSAPERKKQTVARTLSIFAGPKTKISQQLIVAQQQILDAFGDEKWGNDRKLTKGAAGPKGKGGKRPAQAKVSSLKTSIQSVLLGIKEEDQ